MKLTKQYTSRDQQSLSGYFQAIGKFDTLTKEEEAELFRKYTDSSTSASEKRRIRDKLITHNLRFVVTIAKQYQNQGLPLGDLINEGNLGIMKSVDRFDITRGHKFISYSVWWIRQGILQALSDQVRTVRLPLNKAGDLNKFNKIQNRLNQKLEREPTDDEINQACAEAGLKVDGVRTLAIQNPLSLDSTSQFEDDTALINITPDRDTPPPDAGLINESIKIEINDILKSLHPKESHIIKSLFGLDCKPKTLEELGVELNLTRERVRQININAFRKLRIHKKNPILRQYLG